MDEQKKEPSDVKALVFQYCFNSGRDYSGFYSDYKEFYDLIHLNRDDKSNEIALMRLGKTLSEVIHKHPQDQNLISALANIKSDCPGSYKKYLAPHLNKNQLIHKQILETQNLSKIIKRLSYYSSFYTALENFIQHAEKIEGLVDIKTKDYCDLTTAQNSYETLQTLGRGLDPDLFIANTFKALKREYPHTLEKITNQKNDKR
jgi:hypothetical protein